MGDSRGAPWILVSTSILVLSGCIQSVGACDVDAAERVVYDEEGFPAYEGQALAIRTCGAGTFCHAPEIDADLRFGAPAGLAFDVRLASSTPDVGDLSRLAQGQSMLVTHAGIVVHSVTSGSMPPSGVGAEVSGAAPLFHRVPPGERTGPELPGLGTEEGREVFRNWMACRAPVVERIVDRIDGEPNSVGATHEVIETLPIEPTWSDIYERVIERFCATALCHNSSEAAGDLDMSTRDRAYAQLFDVPAGGLRCGDGVRRRIVPGNAHGSLLVHKLEDAGEDGAPICGSRMPVGFSLAPQRIMAIRAWIDAGAPEQ